jgi:hypothetical protein
VPIYSPRGKRPVSFVLLNDHIHGFETHYLPAENPKDARTVPCLARIGDCPWHDQVKNIRWKGFLGALLRATGKRYLLEVTQGAWDTCPDLQQQNGTLRGYTYEVSRKSEAATSQVVYRNQLVIHQGLPIGKVDVLSILSRLWQIPLAKLLELNDHHDGLGCFGHNKGEREERNGNDGNEDPPHVERSDGTGDVRASDRAPADLWRRFRRPHG